VGKPGGTGTGVARDKPYNNRRGLWHAHRQRDAALDSNLVSRDDDLPDAGSHGREWNAAVHDGLAPRHIATPMASCHCGTGCSYQVDVTWAPAGVVLIAEHAYWLLSGSTRIGLMLSEVHPIQQREEYQLANQIRLVVLVWWSRARHSERPHLGRRLWS